MPKGKKESVGKSLSDAVREWLRNSKTKGPATLAAALGEPSDSFRVRLSRNRWSRGILKKLIEQTQLAANLEDLQAKYVFSISERSTRGELGERVRYDIRDAENLLVIEGEDLDDQRKIKAAGLTERETDLVIACKMTQTPINAEFDRLNSIQESTLVVLWKIRECILNDVVVQSSTGTRLHDAKFQSVLSTAIDSGTNVHIHFLVETKNTKDLAVYLADLIKPFRQALESTVSKTEASATTTKRGCLSCYVRCFEKNLVIDCFDYCWFHVVVPNDTLGWLLFDMKDLRLRLKGVSNLFKYTTLAVPMPSDDIARTLNRVGYVLDSKARWVLKLPVKSDDSLIQI